MFNNLAGRRPPLGHASRVQPSPRSSCTSSTLVTFVSHLAPRRRPPSKLPLPPRHPRRICICICRYLFPRLETVVVPLHKLRLFSPDPDPGADVATGGELNLPRRHPKAPTTPALTPGSTDASSGRLERTHPHRRIHLRADPGAPLLLRRVLGVVGPPSLGGHVAQGLARVETRPPAEPSTRRTASRSRRNREGVSASPPTEEGVSLSPPPPPPCLQPCASIAPHASSPFLFFWTFLDATAITALFIGLSTPSPSHSPPPRRRLNAKPSRVRSVRYRTSSGNESLYTKHDVITHLIARTIIKINVPELCLWSGVADGAEERVHRLRRHGPFHDTPVPPGGAREAPRPALVRS